MNRKLISKRKSEGNLRIEQKELRKREIGFKNIAGKKKPRGCCGAVKHLYFYNRGIFFIPFAKKKRYNFKKKEKKNQ